MSSKADGPLSGRRVVAFESRMSGPMANLIAKFGGEAVEAPALREVPIGENPGAREFARRLAGGEFDVVIFLTGVGSRYLAEEIRPEFPLEAFVEALSRVKVVVRGPKPLTVMREWKVRVDVQVPEPNTWRDILAAIDEKLPVNGLRVAIQEYGLPSAELIEGLEARGAIVSSVPVYRWALPENIEPLRRAIVEIAEGRVDAALFTSAQQIVHLLDVAAQDGRAVELWTALAKGAVVVGSIGPATTEALRVRGIDPRYEPEHPKMGHLVAELAERAGFNSIKENNLDSIRPVAPDRPAPDPLRDSLFLRACRREPTDVTPVWLMRQAGRYMAEYREIRSKVTFLELCKRPELATEVTVYAAERLGVDAAILFADILLILEPLGLDLEFAKGEGPVIHNPIRQGVDVDRITPLESPEPLGYVYDAIRAIRAALPANLPLIGFAGAPFTLACYAIEGGSSRHYEKAKAFMFGDPGAWHALMERLVDATVLYLNAQAAAGAQVLQLFDSWVGTLGPADYRTFVQPHMARLFAGLTPGVPTIHFGTDTGSLLELQKEAGGDVIGLDWRVELGPTWDRLGDGVGVQGNLDPAALLAPMAEVRRRAGVILDQAAGRPGHIFNLGHGILPMTPVDTVRGLVDSVHEHRGRND